MAPASNRVLVPIGIASAAVSLYCGLHAAINDDDVYHLHSIWLVAHGVIPYREFFEVHPPGMWVLLAPLARLFDTPSTYVVSARVCTAALFGALVVLAARCIRAGLVQTVYLAVLAGGVLAYCWIWCFRAEYVAALLLILHLSVLAGLPTSPRAWARAALAAAAIGSAATMSVRAMPFLAIEPLFLLLRSESRTRWNLLVAWGAGVVIGALPAAVYLSWHRLWRDAAFWAFRFVASSEVVSWEAHLLHARHPRGACAVRPGSAGDAASCARLATHSGRGTAGGADRSVSPNDGARCDGPATSGALCLLARPARDQESPARIR